MAGTSWYVSHCYDCSALDNSDVNRYDSNERWCSEYRKYVNPNDSACSTRFRNDEAKNPSSNYSSGCYLTTITCEILGMEDDSEILTTLRMFREEYLKKNEKYHDLLCEYDIIGPVIAESIRKCTKPDVVAKYLLETFIQPTVTCIQEERVDLAIAIYSNMVNDLKNFFMIKEVSYEGITPTGKGYIKG